MNAPQTPENLNALHTNATWHQRRLDATPRGVGVMGDFFISHAKNAEFWDIEGRRFIDFAGGIAVLNTGHVHPKVQAAIAAQLQRFTHSCYQVVPYTEYVQLAERINAIVPIDGPAKTAFFSTGAEAVENAIKIARSSTGRSGVVAFGGAFHGRSLFAVAMTGKVQPYKAGFGPFPPEIYHVPFPCHCASLDDTKHAMEQLFKCDIEPSRVAAIIFEPVQGEGGFNPIQPAAVRWLRELCDQHGILLVFDEVQSGFGRTGRWFAMEHFGVVPDIMTVAKGIASGLPLSGVFSRLELMNKWIPGSHGGTYGGNAVACAAAVGTIQAMREENLVENARLRGEQLFAGLRHLQEAYPVIGDVRGLGVMIGAEFRTPNRQPDKATAKAVAHARLDRKLMLLTCGPWDNTIRWIPPLVVNAQQINDALGIFADSLKEVVG